MIGNKQTNKQMKKNSQTQTVAILSSKQTPPGKIIDLLHKYIIGDEQKNKQNKNTNAYYRLASRLYYTQKTNELRQLKFPL